MRYEALAHQKKDMDQEELYTAFTFRLSFSQFFMHYSLTRPASRLYNFSIIITQTTKVIIANPPVTAHQHQTFTFA